VASEVSELLLPASLELQATTIIKTKERKLR